MKQQRSAALGESFPEMLLDVGSTPTASTIVQAPEKKSLELLYCNGSELFQRVLDHFPYLMKTYS